MSTAAWALLGIGFVLLVVAAGSGPTEGRWREIRAIIPPPVREARWPLAIVGTIMLGLGVLVAVRVIDVDGDDPPRPADRFRACTSALRETGPPMRVEQDAELLRPAIKVHSGPVDLVPTSTSLFVAHTDGRITRIPLKDTPPQVEALPGVEVGEGRSSQVSIANGFTSLWVVKREQNSSRGVLAKIPRGGGSIEKSIPVNQPDNVAVGGGNVWVTTDNGKLLRFDPEDLEQKKPDISIGGEPHGLWVDGPCLYVATTDDPDGFVASNATTGEKIGGYRVGGAGEVTVGAGALWLTGKRAKPEILRVDPAHPETAAKSTSLEVTPSVDALAVGKRGAWTADGTATVVRVAPNGELVESMSIGGQPVNVAITDEPEMVWVALKKSDAVLRIRP